jgi:hypothetical protein
MQSFQGKRHLLTMVVSSRVTASFCEREAIEGAFWDTEAREPVREVRAFADGEATEVGRGIPAALADYDGKISTHHHMARRWDERGLTPPKALSGGIGPKFPNDDP